MSTYVNSYFEKRVDQLLDLAQLIERAFASASIDYRVVGGLATYLYVEQAAPEAGRLTRDIDVAVRRADMQRIRDAVEPLGLTHRHSAGLDMLVQAANVSARSAVHLIFADEKVREDYVQATPELGSYRSVQGLRLIPLQDLIGMKLTSFRAKDEAHLKDLDEAGLITPEIEECLLPVLRERLRQLRARD